jgi:hypothetical protein
MNTKLSGILCDSPDEFLVDSVRRDKGGNWNADVRFLGAKIGFSAFSVAIFRKPPGLLETLLSVLRTVARINWYA